MKLSSRKLSGEVLRTPLTYKQALAWLYGLQRFGIKLGLENIRRLLTELHIDLGSARASRAVSGASPETSAAAKIIHVAGTNGKGSVCAIIDSILRAQGYRPLTSSRFVNAFA